MIKIKVKDKPKYIDGKVKYKSCTALEATVLLDVALDLLKNEFEMSNEEIAEYLNYYRKEIKEKESD